jgi:hypothetical protein
MGRKAIALLTIGNKRYVHYVGRNTIRWHLVGKIKPCDTRYVYFKGGMSRRLLQSNDKLRGTWRGVCQTILVVIKNSYVLNSYSK